MPRDLPGFYWDPNRNRYFPISAKPPAPSQLPQLHHHSPPTPPSNNSSYNLPSQSSQSPSRSRQHRKYRRNIWRLTDLGKSEVLNHNQRSLLRHDLFGLHVSKSLCMREQRVPIFGDIRKFISMTTETGQCYRLLGDSQGWIYTSHNPLNASLNPGLRNLPVPRDEWTVETNLDSESEISSLNICDTYSLATSFGPVSKMRVQKLDDVNFSVMITVKDCHDIRCSAYTTPTEIVVGAKQYAVYLMDIFDYPQTRILKTHSDVFSITRTRDLVYAGARNGSIHRFDLRVPDSNGTKNIFSNKYQTRSTVLYMQHINDIQFLTSYMNGDLLLYDIRYTRNTTPVLQFPGHVNTHTSRLGIAVDPTSEFLFAAGQDRKVRGWSIRTGDLLLPPSPSSTFNTLSNHSRNPFLMEFENPIETLQVTREPRLTFSQDEYGSYEDLGGGMCLWAGSGDTLYTFDLGCLGC